MTDPAAAEPDTHPDWLRWYGAMPRHWGRVSLAELAALSALVVAAGIAGRKRVGYAIADPADLLVEALEVDERSARRYLAALEAAELIAVERSGLRIVSATTRTEAGWFPFPLVAPRYMADRAGLAALAGLCDVLTGPGRRGVSDGLVLAGEATVRAVAARAGCSTAVARRGLAAAANGGLVTRVEQDGDTAGDWWTVDYARHRTPYSAALDLPSPLDTEARVAMSATDIELTVIDTLTTVAPRVGEPVGGLGSATPTGQSTGQETTGGIETGNACCGFNPHQRARTPSGPVGERSGDRRVVDVIGEVLAAPLVRLVYASWPDPGVVARHHLARTNAARLRAADLELLVECFAEGLIDVGLPAEVTHPRDDSDGERTQRRLAGLVARRLVDALDHLDESNTHRRTPTPKPRPAGVATTAPPAHVGLVQPEDLDSATPAPDASGIAPPAARSLPRRAGSQVDPRAVDPGEEPPPAAQQSGQPGPESDAAKSRSHRPQIPPDRLDGLRSGLAAARGALPERSGAHGEQLDRARRALVAAEQAAAHLGRSGGDP